MATANEKLKASYAINSDRGEQGGWLVVFGLVLEIVEIPFPIESYWLRAIPPAIIAVGVWMEIHFGRKARFNAELLQDASDAKAAPRRLSDEQLATLTNEMMTWARLPNSDEAQSAAVFSVTSTFESSALADQIAAALERAGWRINRHQVTYGKEFRLAGVGMLTGPDSRGVAVADALTRSLSACGLYAFVLPDKRPGASAADNPADPFHSSISVMVGDHP